ncbi:MAG TPA: hypothetical protein VJZ91_15845 [Blastocatellia bacterium]|nr:hypothetical protein [Blastocatellia bacterium]
MPLPLNTPLSGTLAPRSSTDCTFGETQYTLQYPGGATQVKVEISVASQQQAAHLGVAARFGQRVTIENGRFFFDFAGGAAQPLYFPTFGPHLFEAGTYFIALRNCGSEQVDFTIRATLLRPTDADTATVTPENAFGVILAAPPDSCSLSQTQYRVDSPGYNACSGLFVIVSAQGDQNITLYARRDQRVVIEDGRVVADQAATIPSKIQDFILSARGTYYVAVGNCSMGTVNYVVFTGEGVTDPPAPALVNGCRIMREPNGTFVLMVFGAGIKEGATVTVGGLTPKKVKFVELEPGSTTSYKTIRLVKKFCGGLPGNIVVANGGPCDSPQAFFCNERCPD